MNRRIRSRTYGGVEGREPKGSPLSDRQLQSQALRPGFAPKLGELFTLEMLNEVICC